MITLKSADVTGGNIDLDYQRSTQFNSPFSVLSQTQNARPEGDLVGVSIGDNGLVEASYSNGSQKALGKILIANFERRRVCVRLVTQPSRNLPSRARPFLMSLAPRAMEQFEQVPARGLT